MKKLLLTAAFFLVLAFYPKPSFAQSPLNCGLLNESCCNLAGGTPNSCKQGVGLICSGGKCISDGTNANPPTRGASSTPLVGPSVGCPNPTEINTAIGCIPFGDTNAFVGFILRWAIGVGGGIAFLLILMATFQIMSSSGDPERLKGGQELLTSAIAGLIMLIFSVFILKVIGVDILKLPGFGT